jgi:hypothetical protein
MSPFGEFQNWHVIARPEHPFLRAVVNKVVGAILLKLVASIIIIIIFFWGGGLCFLLRETMFPPPRHLQVLVLDILRGKSKVERFGQLLPRNPHQPHRQCSETGQTNLGTATLLSKYNNNILGIGRKCTAKAGY